MAKHIRRCLCSKVPHVGFRLDSVHLLMHNRPFHYVFLSFFFKRDTSPSLRRASRSLSESPIADSCHEGFSASLRSPRFVLKFLLEVVNILHLLALLVFAKFLLVAANLLLQAFDLRLSGELPSASRCEIDRWNRPTGRCSSHRCSPQLRSDRRRKDLHRSNCHTPTSADTRKVGQNQLSACASSLIKSPTYKDTVSGAM